MPEWRGCIADAGGHRAALGLPSRAEPGPQLIDELELSVQSLNVHPLHVGCFCACAPADEGNSNRRPSNTRPPSGVTVAVIC